MRRSGDQHRVYRDQHATAKRSIRERWADTGQDHPMPYEGRRLSPVHVGRADVHGHILSQQATLEGATPYSKMHNLEPDLTGLRAIGARAFVHRETYTKKLEDRAFEGKLCGYSHNSKAYRIYNPAKGTVVESRNVTFLETPAYTLPPDVTTEDYHYEEDVLRFTSVLDSSLLEKDLFTPNCDLSSAELEGQVQRLRQEVRRLSKINAAQSPSPSSTLASPGVAVDQRDAGTREPEPASPSINQEPENEDEHGPPLPAAPVTGPSLRIRSDGRPFEVTRASTRRSPSSKDTEYPGALHTLFPPPTTTTREPSPPVNFSTLPHRRRHQC